MDAVAGDPMENDVLRLILLEALKNLNNALLPDEPAIEAVAQARNA